MKKNEKISLNFNNFADLPDNFFNSVKTAEENDLKVLCAISVIKDLDTVDKAELCKKIGIDESDFKGALKYWRGAGVIVKVEQTSPEGINTVPKKEIESAHRNGKLEQKSELPSYTSSELSALIEKRHITTEFIDEAQRVFGRIFNTHDINILVGMIDYIGFDEESVIIILSYAAKKGYKTLRNAEKLALALYDEGVTDSSMLSDYIAKIEDSKNTVNKVRKMFGMVGRDLTATEKGYLKSWVKEMGYGEDVIRLAYDITVDATQNPAPAYTNKILKSWYGLGLSTAASVKKYLEESKSTRKSAKTEKKSFDTDEFFEAALKRTFDEM